MKVPSAKDIDGAVSILRKGGVIAMPSDTLYALSAAASDVAAVRRVFDIKGREEGRPLPLFIDGLDMAERIGVFDDTVRVLARRFWPGQLTIVVRRQPGYASGALAGGDTVALRAPDHPVALAVLRGLGEAVTGTSANLTGGPDPASAEEVRRQLGDRLDLVIDAGVTAHGVASTIIDCSGPRPDVLREGAVDKQLIADALRDTEG